MDTVLDKIPGLADLNYIVDIMKPEILAVMISKYLSGEKAEKLDHNNFLNYSYLKYISETKDKQSALNLIVKIEKIHTGKNYASSSRVQKLEIMDAMGNTIDLLLWDHQPEVVDKLNLDENCVIYLQNTNTRMDKYGNKVLNAGRMARITDISEYIELRRFTQKYSTVLNLALPKNGIFDIVGEITQIYPIKQLKIKNRTSSIQKIEINDGNSSIQIVFWGQYSKIISEFTAGQKVRLTKIKISQNKYKKIFEGNYGPDSSIIHENNHFNNVVSNYKISNRYNHDTSKTNNGFNHKNKITTDIKNKNGMNVTSLVQTKKIIRINQKNVSFKGKVAELPILREIKTSVDVQKMWVFVLEKEGYLYYVRMFVDIDELKAHIQLDDLISLSNVNIKNSISKYDYDIFVSSNSSIELIKNV